MSRHRFTPEQLDWLRAAYRVDRVPELTQRFNRRFGLELAETKIRWCLNRHKIDSGRPPGLSAGEARRTYSDEELAWLMEHRPKMEIRHLAEVFSERFRPVTWRALAERCRYYGIKSWRTGRFGTRPPWNLGIPMQVTGRMAETQFAPGNLPWTTHPIGAYAQDAYGRWKLKISDDRRRPGASRRNWRFVSHLTWEAAHGPIPPAHVVCVLDGNEDHCLDADNLLCIPRAVLARANQAGYGNLPPDRDLRRAALLEAHVRHLAHQRAEQLGMSRRERRAAIGVAERAPE